jgi:ADP-ribose pyrophosphatase YjhB (NUDIX family)
VVVEFADGQQTISWDDLLDDGGADVRASLWMVKSHVKGHTKADGTYVRPYERRGMSAPKPVAHPKLGEKGEVVTIKDPHFGSAPSTWANADSVATFLPGGDVPAKLNGVPLRRWKDHPRTEEGWDYVDGVNEDLAEPAFHCPPGKKPAAGVIIEEPDGRVWIISPTNRFGGYRCTFPKGTAEEGLSLQANAIKEAFEESGLKIEITGFIGDYERTTSVARMYRAKRVGGDPTDAGWETQSVHLVPKSHLYEHLNGWADHPVAEAIGAGPAPKPPPPPPMDAKGWNWKGQGGGQGQQQGLFGGGGKGEDKSYFKGPKPQTPFPEKKT